MSDVLRIASGAIVWAVHFALLYGLTALACARGQPRMITWVIVIATLVAVGVAVAIVFRSYAHREQFTPWMTGAVAAIAAVAMVWEAVAGMVAGRCA